MPKCVVGGPGPSEMPGLATHENLPMEHEHILLPILAWGIFREIHGNSIGSV